MYFLILHRVPLYRNEKLITTKGENFNNTKREFCNNEKEKDTIDCVIDI